MCIMFYCSVIINFYNLRKIWHKPYKIIEINESFVFEITSKILLEKNIAKICDYANQ